MAADARCAGGRRCRCCQLKRGEAAQSLFISMLLLAIGWKDAGGDISELTSHSSLRHRHERSKEDVSWPTTICFSSQSIFKASLNLYLLLMAKKSDKSTEYRTLLPGFLCINIVCGRRSAVITASPWRWHHDTEGKEEARHSKSRDNDIEGWKEDRLLTSVLGAVSLQLIVTLSLWLLFNIKKHQDHLLYKK